MIEKSGTAGTTIFMQDEAGHLIGEYDGSGNLIEETVWLGDIPVATLRPNGSGVNIFYVHTDHLNTPRKIAQPSSGTLAWRWDTDPFGTAAPNSNPAGLGTFAYNLRFPGQYYQAETGLNQNYFRDYDATVGRYIESDPIGLRGGINTYAYAAGNPISRRDSLGLLDNPAEVINLFPPTPSSASYGISAGVSTINPATSGGGGSYGISLQYTPDSGWHWYKYYTPPKQPSCGFQLGFSATVNAAIGHGAWTGPFEQVEGNIGPVAFGQFDTPGGSEQNGYYGFQLGYSAGAPYGVGQTVTNYSYLFH
jgi:RHS repeat-associated protein